MEFVFLILGLIFIYQLIKAGSVGVLGFIYAPKNCFYIAMNTSNVFLKTFWVFVGFIWLLFGLGILFVIGFKFFTGRWI